MMPPLLGVEMYVQVQSGLHGERGLFAETVTGQLATISSSTPQIFALNSTDCERQDPPDPLRLVRCPFDRTFMLNVTVWTATLHAEMSAPIYGSAMRCWLVSRSSRCRKA